MITIATFESYDNRKVANTTATYNCIKPTLIKEFETYLTNQKSSTRGRKRELDLSIFFKAFYAVARDGVSTTNLEDYFGISKSSYFRYFGLLQQSGIIKQLHRSVAENYQLDELLMGDTFTVKSHDGSESVGANPTDRGRNGIKVQVISDINGVIDNIVVEPANYHDSKIFRNNLTKHYDPSKKILLDSAYVGQPIKIAAENKGLSVVVVPKKLSNGQPSHVLDDQDALLIKRRWRIERIIGMLRRYKGISNKYTKFIRNYIFYLELAVFIVICYNIFISQ